MNVFFTDQGRYLPDTKLWCKLCCSPSNDVRSFLDHNHGVKHKQKLVNLNLPQDHEDFEFQEEHIMIPFYYSEYYRGMIFLYFYIILTFKCLSHSKYVFSLKKEYRLEVSLLNCFIIFSKSLFVNGLPSFRNFHI
jgi:hypothetical protein